mmetsp:Transcript_8639/g.24265  ORF Transcript_8639/g.24265 Transcript_8639/m.24265 type:complete len:219 (-) Transcript_8639:652-1308(-)
MRSAAVHCGVVGRYVAEPDMTGRGNRTFLSTESMAHLLEGLPSFSLASTAAHVHREVSQSAPSKVVTTKVLPAPSTSGMKLKDKMCCPSISMRRSGRGRASPLGQDSKTKAMCVVTGRIAEKLACRSTSCPSSDTADQPTRPAPSVRQIASSLQLAPFLQLGSFASEPTLRARNSPRSASSGISLRKARHTHTFRSPEDNTTCSESRGMSATARNPVW